MVVFFIESAHTNLLKNFEKHRISITLKKPYYSAVFVTILLV